MSATENDPILYYNLQPIRRSDQRRGGIATACCVTCIATGKILEGMGGPGYALAPEIVDALDSNKTGWRGRVVLDARDVERAAALLLKYKAALELQVRNLGGPHAARIYGLGETLVDIDKISSLIDELAPALPGGAQRAETTRGQ